MDDDEIIFKKPITVKFDYENVRDETESRTVDITSIESGISCDNNGNDIEGIAVSFTGFCHLRQAERTFCTETVMTDMIIVGSGNVIPQKLLNTGLLPAADFIELLEHAPENPVSKPTTRLSFTA